MLSHERFYENALGHILHATGCGQPAFGLALHVNRDDYVLAGQAIQKNYRPKNGDSILCDGCGKPILNSDLMTENIVWYE